MKLLAALKPEEIKHGDVFLCNLVNPDNIKEIEARSELFEWMMSPDVSQMGASSISRIIANTCCQNRTQSLIQIRHEVMSDPMLCRMTIFAFRKFV